MEDFHRPELEGKVDLAFNLVSTFRYLDSEKAALAHLEGTRRLLHPEPFGGTGDVLFFCNRDEVAKVAKFHKHIFRVWICHNPDI